jgi:hypothetical protein
MPGSDKGHCILQGRRAEPGISELAVHAAIGVCLGTTMAVSLLATNTANIFNMIMNDAQPVQTAGVFVGGFASLFGVGAALSGFLFARCGGR